MATRPTTNAPEATLIVRRTYPVTAERLFRAWSEPADLMRWFGPPGLDTPTAELDFRVGGLYRIGMRRHEGGDLIFVGGEYREIVPNRRIVFTWSFENHVAVTGTLVTIEFRDVPGGAELVLMHESLPSLRERTSHESGWTGILEKLAVALAA